MHSIRLSAMWVSALVRVRTLRLAATAAGIALAVGLLAAVGAFLSGAKATMTARAIATVAVDWQVETRADADAAAVANAVKSTEHVVAAEPVAFGSTSGFETSEGGTTRTTGPGLVLGIGDSYQTTFPTQFRSLVGNNKGVLLYQQTAANLGATPGSTVTVQRAGLRAVDLVVDGIVDIPQADTLFQNVGAPPGGQPQAPPDNVLVVPAPTWHTIFDPLAATRPDLARTQFHARLDHHLPSDPAAAYNTSTRQANNLEARLSGAVRVADNTGAALSAARSDALYAQVLFLFLGTPGAVLAGLLTAGVAGSNRDARRRDHALLRTRGATTRLLVGLGVSEAAFVGVVGGLGGLVLARLVGHLAFGSGRFGATTASALWWSLAAVAFGLLVAVATIALPARRDAREIAVTTARRQVGRAQNPRWLRYGIDVLLVAGAAVVFWLTSRNGYTLVLAPEGVPNISVSYWALLGPALLWVSIGLLTYRLTNAALARGRRLIAFGLRPLATDLAGTVAASMSRQRRRVASGAALVALTVGFAASTAIFNATYQQQSRIDAVLTNGADITVTTAPGAVVSPTSPTASQIAQTAGVHHVEPLQHRFAYVGNDLQDLYGVDTTSIVRAGRLQDAYFHGGSAATLMSTLGERPDSVLVSAETVHDYQLRIGDAITLRLQDGQTKQFVDVPFHYVGVAKEFPTAPRDSFLVANADYVAKMTGSNTIGAFLIDTGGNNTTSIAERLRAQLGASVTVTDVVTARHIVGSSLTAVDLSGLTKVELTLALLLAAAAAGLTLWLGLAERRRMYAIAAALGADRRQLGTFVWAEVGLVALFGLICGAIGSWVLATMLVKVLTGVFDPPPSALAVPWDYLIAVGAISLAATAVAAVSAIRSAQRAPIDVLRTP